MLQVLTNLLTLKAIGTPREVYAGLGLVWLLLLSAAFASVAGRSWSSWAKILWFLMLACLPIIGMACYCLYCLWAADYGFLNVFGMGRKNPRHRTVRRGQRHIKSPP